MTGLFRVAIVAIVVDLYERVPVGTKVIVQQ
jgi:hypothetical protein